MLKLVAGLVAGATLLTTGSVSAFAASQENGIRIYGKTQVRDSVEQVSRWSQIQDGGDVYYTLSAANNGLGQNYVDEDNNGVCDNLGTGTGGMGQNYVDEDNDGVCDNWGTGTGGGSMGRGSGSGNGYRGRHHG